jgi:hypothetical protein
MKQHFVIEREDEQGTLFKMWEEPEEQGDINEPSIALLTVTYHIRPDELAGQMLKVSNNGEADVTFRMSPYVEAYEED